MVDENVNGINQLKKRKIDMKHDIIFFKEDIANSNSYTLKFIVQRD